LLISIEDNGPGFNSEGLLRSEDKTTHESLGIKLVVDRIKLLNQLGYEIDLVFKSVPEKGTKVLLTFKNIVEV
jgi:sensor histidine kinase YesM